jgi:hypothetical protein
MIDLNSTKGERIVRVSRTGVFVFLLLGFPLAGPATQTDHAVRLNDNSDWWSASRNPDSDENIHAEKREFPKSNFQILGIDLRDTMFSKAAARLGTTTIIERGDASTGRSQACYVSPGDKQVHLIFEQGEVEFTFYLFADGLVWEGSDRCATSKEISRSLATASGLHLGQTPTQVIAVLGKPTKERENEFIYSFSVRKKTSAEDLKQARQHNPDLSEKDFQENYGFYDLNAGICARFEHSKLTYLAVSKSECGFR